MWEKPVWGWLGLVNAVIYFAFFLIEITQARFPTAWACFFYSVWSVEYAGRKFGRVNR